MEDFKPMPILERWATDDAGMFQKLTPRELKEAMRIKKEWEDNWNKEHGIAPKD